MEQRFSDGPPPAKFTEVELCSESDPPTRLLFALKGTENSLPPETILCA